MASFRRKHMNKPVPGTRTSPQTGQVITSSGNPSLDVIVGGGLPVGSICLIEEDKYMTYSKVLAKYFVAEGVVSSQAILLASLDDDPKEIMRKLPKPLNDDEVEKEKAIEQENEDSPKNGLRIAWRYNDLPPVNSEQSPSKIGHHFNLMEEMDKNLLDFVDQFLWNGKTFISSDENEFEDYVVLGDDENLLFGAEPNAQKYDSDQNTTSSSSGSNTSVKDGEIEQEHIEAVAAGILGSPTKSTAATTAGGDIEQEHIEAVAAGILCSLTKSTAATTAVGGDIEQEHLEAVAAGILGIPTKSTAATTAGGDIEQEHIEAVAAGILCSLTKSTAATTAVGGDIEQEHIEAVAAGILGSPTKSTAATTAVGGDIEQEVIEAVAAEILSSPTKSTATMTKSSSISSEKTSTTTSNLDSSSRRSYRNKKQDNVHKIFNNPKYQRLLKLIQSFAKDEKFTPGALVYRSLCRICITSLGSPLWYDDDFSKHILKFLTVLRGIVRNSVSVCFISMPMHLIAKYDETLVPKIRNLVDYAIELESFAGSERETNPVFKDYNGLLHLHKITAVNTLTAYVPETCDLAFKLRRKKFVIEKLHLPPDLKDNDAESKPTISCSSATTSSAASMDF